MAQALQLSAHISISLYHRGKGGLLELTSLLTSLLKSKLSISLVYTYLGYMVSTI